jgi:hypothetical protein
MTLTIVFRSVDGPVLTLGFPRIGHVATRIVNEVKRVVYDIIGIVFMLIGTYLARRIA